MPKMICRTCSSGGVEHYCSHVVTVFEVGGKRLPEPLDKCPHCGAADADLVTPADQKIWMMRDVNPNEYEWVGGEKRLKDWAQADLEARIGREDEDEVRAQREAIERKRQQVREQRTMGKTSLSRTEIELIDSALRDGFRKAEAEDAGLVLPE